MNLSEELKWRGLFKQTTYKDINELDSQKVTFYWGIDPSADSMTIGNLVAAVMVKTFIKHGHKAIVLVGGATGLIGDPDGKIEERKLLSQEDLEKNKNALIKQCQTILGQDNFELVDNITWLKDYTYLNFLRDIGKHVPMRQMLNRDFVNRRLSDEGHGISYAEFSYVLIQAYDFLHLNKNKDVTLQVCGSDQWGNSIAGVELVRRINGSEAHVYSVPLIVDDATGRKFGKSEEGAIWLDSAKTTPTQFFQFWINIPDDKVESYIKLFTSITQEELTNLMNQQKDNPAQRSAQNYLAVNVTKLVHGVESTNQAQKVTDIIIGKQDLTNALDQATLDIIKRELPNTKISAGSEIAQVLVKTQLAPSNSEARKLITSKAISINGQKISKDKFDSTDFKNGLLILRRGKAFKDSALIELE